MAYRPGDQARGQPRHRAHEQRQADPADEEPFADQIEDFLLTIQRINQHQVVGPGSRYLDSRGYRDDRLLGLTLPPRHPGHHHLLQARR